MQIITYPRWEKRAAFSRSGLEDLQGRIWARSDGRRVLNDHLSDSAPEASPHSIATRHEELIPARLVTLGQYRSYMEEKQRISRAGR